MKTIKVTNTYIAKVMPTIFNGQVMPNPVAESLKKKKIPTLAQYWSRRALDKIARLFKAYEETRQELIKQHGRKDKDGQLLIVMRDAAKIKEIDKPIDGFDFVSSELETAMKGEGISPQAAKAISKWSDGKISAESDGNILIENMAELQKELNELLEEEIDLGINLIKIDLKAWEENERYDILSGEEMDLLWPMLDIE